MAKNLKPYRDKRDPTRTSEPFGPEPLRRSAATRVGRYVVHLHDATRKHYDLRIEVGGVLKSFAVPKGPSLDPSVKHLAVQTEDHPIDYLDFEAVIGAGNYGAGPMILWDTGTIQYLETTAEDGLAKGKVDFVLQGFKLRGRFALVETGRRKDNSDGKRQWLLLKKTDAFIKTIDITVDEPTSVLSGLRIDELENASAIAATIAEDARKLGARKGAPDAKALVPMRCAENGAKLDDPKSFYELKMDGVRILAERNEQQVNLRYRTQRNTTAAYPEIVRAVRALSAERFVLDGEIIAWDEHGKPSFARLARRIHAHGLPEVRKAQREVPAVYFVFDILSLGDLDLRSLPLRERKALLSRLVPGKGVVRVLDHVVGHGSALMAFCEQQNLEGIVAKRADSHYVSGGERSSHWSKVKRVVQDDFVVIGFTEGKGSHKRLGAFEIASFVGDELVTRGRVGSGLKDSSVNELHARLLAIETPKCAAQGELMAAPAGRTFVEPKVVISVEHAGFSPDGRLRHPVFRGLREDIDPRECTAAPQEEREAAVIKEAEEEVLTRGRLQGSHVTITNADKVFWPDEGFTKGDLCTYYASVAETLLPYLRDRPVLMVRYPDGIAGKHFYQWNVPAGTPSWVRTERIYSEEHAREITFFRIEDLDTLVYVANLGCIPLHVLASRFYDLERCDFLTIDFDLGPAPLSAAITLARTLHEILEQVGLVGFPKTSGQTGLHVLVPLGGAAFAVAKNMADLLGRLLHARHPDISTIERKRAKRPSAVYVDTGQTGRSRAIVAPYSVRAHPGATVSTPLHWDEVHQGLNPVRFDMQSVPDRLSELGDPMQALPDTEPDIAQAIGRLGELITSAGKRSRS